MNLKKIVGKTKTRLMQHGFTSGHLVQRIGNRRNNILANSLPKAGTNLLIRAIVLHQCYRRPLVPTLNEKNLPFYADKITKGFGRVFTAHLHYSSQLNSLLSENDVKHVLIVRDPRDVVVSNVHYIEKMDKGHSLHNYYNQLSNFDDRLHASIGGVRKEYLPEGVNSFDINTYLERFYAWVDNGVFLVKFENLIGEAGGGDQDLQLEELIRLEKYLGLYVDESTSDVLRNNLFNREARTFREGQAGAWRNSFTDEHVEHFKNLAQPMLEALGYESDSDWGVDN